MFISNSVIIDIVDKSAQSITSRPINEQIVYVADGRPNQFLANVQEVKISVVTPLGMLHETPVQFTDALYGAMVPDTAEFARGQVFKEVVHISNQAGIGNFVNANILVYTGPYYEGDAIEPETHYIGGTISEDGFVTVLEKDVHTFIKREAFSAGAYQMDIPYRAEVDVIAKSNNDGEVLGFGNIVPKVKVE